MYDASENVVTVTADAIRIEYIVSLYLLRPVSIQS